MIPRRTVLLSIPALSLAAACGRRNVAGDPDVLGNFQLGFAVVVAKNMKKVPISRDATVADWEAALQKALDDRFGRFTEGTKAYNIGVNVDAYALAPPGIPIVASPKSILVVSAIIYDDATATLLNPEGKGHQITAFERTSGDSVVGSGLTKTAQEQMDELAYVAAQSIEDWLRENPEWFGLPRRRRRAPSGDS